jgi:hypothetical protein
MMDVAAARSVQSRVEGRITTPQGAGISGANVLLQGTNLATNTDTAGKFKIDHVPAGEQRLIVRRLGYEMKTIPISVNDSVTSTNASLDASSASLAEVVATGGASPTPLRLMRADTTDNSRRTVYEVSPGVAVTLVETMNGADEKDLAIKQRAKAMTAAKDSPVSATTSPRAATTVLESPARAPQNMPSTTNTITWRDGKGRYALTGPFTTKQLEEIKARLMKTRQ